MSFTAWRRRAVPQAFPILPVAVLFIGCQGIGPVVRQAHRTETQLADARASGYRAAAIGTLDDLRATARLAASYEHAERLRVAAEGGLTLAEALAAHQETLDDLDAVDAKLAAMRARIEQMDAGAADQAALREGIDRILASLEERQAAHEALAPALERAAEMTVKALEARAARKAADKASKRAAADEDVE